MTAEQVEAGLKFQPFMVHYTASKHAVTGMARAFAAELGKRPYRWGTDFIPHDGRTRNFQTGKSTEELLRSMGRNPIVLAQTSIEEGIKANPKLQIIRSQSGEFTRAKGKEVMESFLKQRDKKIDVLFAHNDDMAIGAIQAIEEAGLKPGQDIVIISIDGVRGAFEAMKAGKLNVTVECNPLLGPQLMRLAQDVVAKRPVEKRITVEEGVFPAEVAARELPNRKY